LHFDVNNGNDTTPDYSDTINPKYFWPNQFRSLMADESEHSDHIEIDFKYDNPEYFIDQILIDYVGEDKFNQWMDENNPEDRTLTNFKKHFNVTDKDIEKLNKEAKEKAEKKNKMKKSNNK